MFKRVLVVLGIVVAFAFLAFSGTLLSIFGPSGPTQTDVFLRDGILGTYVFASRELMSAASYEDGAMMVAQAGLIVSNPKSLGFDAYLLSSARYVWVAYDADGVVIFPGRSTNVAPDWPLVFSPPDSDPGNRLIYEFSTDSWAGNGVAGVEFVSFALLIDYSVKISGVWEDKLGLFAADGAVITAPILPPPPDDPPPEDPPVDPPIDPPADDPVNGDGNGGEGETGGFDFVAILSYVLAIVILLVVLLVLVFLPVPITVKVVAFVVAIVLLFIMFPYLGTLVGG